MALKYKASNENLPDESEDDYVNCVDFWENEGKDILSKGLIGRSFKGLLMEPKLSFWAPYIGADTRSGHFVVNSEHRKIRRDNGEPE
eukprot:gene11766-2071_t